MNERISALMDGELDEAERYGMVGPMSRARPARDCWADYHLIGDALRQSSHLSQDISSRVMAALEDEPVVLAPQRQAPRAALTPFAMAASVAAVLMVAGFVWGDKGGNTDQLAAAASQVEVARVPEGLTGENLQAYLVAHQTHAPTQTMHGAPHYLKTVAMDIGASR